MQTTVAAVRGGRPRRGLLERTKRSVSKSPQTIQGKLRFNYSGSIAVDTDRGAFNVDKSALGGALHGDEVLVRCRDTHRGIRGEIVRVLCRPPRRLTGVVDPARGFIADDVRFPWPLRCERPTSAHDRQALYGAVLCDHRDEDEREVRLVCTFGERGTAAEEREAMLWREHIEEGFPRDALEEARSASRRPHTPSGWHEDLRELPFVTIDPPDAEDHDDALFAERLTGGRTRCCVAIADVASLIEEGGPLDLEAQERGATLYIPGRLVPMLPHCISSDAASLMPNEDRRAVVLDVVLDPTGRIQRRRLRLGIIRSRERLSYEEAADLLYDPAGAHADVRPFAPMVQLLDQVASVLRERRATRGAVQIDTPSVRIDVDREGEPLRMRQVQADAYRKRACGLVEELMLLANESVAEMLEDAGLDGFCRAHAPPSEALVSRVLETAARHQIRLAPELVRDARALQRHVHTITNAAARSALSAALLDAMPAANYARGRREHFALATGQYVHFTSPIRRYPDVLVHRAVHALVKGSADDLPPLDIELLNETQQRARRIHQEINSLYGALVARELIDTPHFGTVVRVSPGEISVLTDDPAVTIRCRQGGRAPVHGARVVVVPKSVDIAKRAVYGLVREEESTVRGARKDYCYG